MVKFSLDKGWKFHKGDIVKSDAHTHMDSYNEAKAGGAGGPASPEYNVGLWENIDLPHDWVVENPFEEKWGTGNGYKERGKGWYVKRFRLEETDRDKQLLIEFGGVATHCTVWLNGSVVGRNFCGYNSFLVDITDMAVYGEKINTLVVFVDATVAEGWWYEGAGIYRHVDLYKRELLHIKHYGVFVHPELITEDVWDTRIDTELENDTDDTKDVIVKNIVFDDKNEKVGQAEEHISLVSGETVKVKQYIPVNGVTLWDIDNPVRYTLVTELYEKDTLLETRETKFGYRTIAIDKDNGFFLNGRRVPLYGTCNHQDHAGVGVAVPDSIQEYRIRLLKEMGTNAYRCAHGNPAPEILEACDKYGMLVMDENRRFNTSRDGLWQVRDMVLRDRNHPSVIMYSIFNEEPLQGTPIGRKLAKRIDREIKKYDNTRFTVSAMHGGFMNEEGSVEIPDITGINYNLAMYDEFREKFPHRPMLGSENNSAFQVRGEYRTDHGRNILDSYDNECAMWGNTHRDGFKQIDMRKHVMGYFIWTGFDYRGEPTPFTWPSVSSFFGIMDTCGFKKDAYYINKAFFSTEPMIHVLPHWNWNPGEMVRVMVHTNCEEAEVFLNGRSMGRKSVDKYQMPDWQIAYEPGILCVTGYRNGKAVCTDEVKTAGKAVKLILEPHREFVYGGCEDAVAVNVYAVDENMVPVPDADMLVSFRAEGGRIIGVGNGNPNSHEADKADKRKLFHGCVQAIVQLTGGAGKLRVTAMAEGLEATTVEIRIVSGHEKTYLESVNEVYINKWRTNVEAFSRKPAADMVIEDNDMNSWMMEEVDYSPKFNNQTGYGMFKAKVEIPRDARRILFTGIVGDEVEIYINNTMVWSGEARVRDGRSVEIENIGTGTIELTVIIGKTNASDSKGAGIIKPVMFLEE